MSVEKKRNFIIQFTYLLIIGMIGFFVTKYVFPLLTPFIIGLIIAIIVRNVAGFIIKKTGYNNKIIYGFIILPIRIFNIHFPRSSSRKIIINNISNWIAWKKNNFFVLLIKFV